MRSTEKTCTAVILVWAGLSLGGNLIAAPAKFQVSSLTIAQLVSVGRAQFAWLGLAELGFATALLALALITRRRPSWVLAASITLLFIQQFAITPILQARSDMMQVGTTPPESHIHLVFVALEVVKFLCLVISGWHGLPTFAPSGDPQPASSPGP